MLNGISYHFIVTYSSSVDEGKPDVNDMSITGRKFLSCSLAFTEALKGENMKKIVIAVMTTVAAFSAALPLSIAFADTTASTSVATDVTAGSLSIDSATSSLDFGTINLDTLATTAFSKDGDPAVVTVSDLTGTTTGWTLQGSFSGLQNADETALSGSKLTIDGTILTTDPQTLTTGERGASQAQTLTTHLDVASSDQVLNGDYTGTVTWNLTSGVDNTSTPQ